MMKIKIAALAILFSTALALHSHAQEPPPFDDAPPEGGPLVPVDGGASLLMAAGVAFGAKKLKEARTQKAAPVSE